jgi:hypothetical protein
MIYLGPSPDNPIDQGDIVDQCPLTFLTEYDMDLPGQGEIECVPTRVLVLTQTCDLAHRKISAVTAAIVHEAPSSSTRVSSSRPTFADRFGLPGFTAGTSCPQIRISASTR